MKHEALKPLGVVALVLAVGAIIAGFVAGSTLSWLSLALAVFLYFFLPGFSLLLHLDLDGIERSIFAFPVGGIAVSLVLYFLNLFGIALTRITVLGVIIGITAVAIVLLHRKLISSAR
jgi:hypothetical protein